MGNKKKKGLTIRKWLNTNLEKSAFIVAHIDGEARYRYGTVKISDCDRQITLDIDLDTPADTRNTLRKLGIVRDTIDAVIEHINTRELK